MNNFLFLANVGSVYVFVSTDAGVTWSAVQKLLPPPGSDGLTFGGNLALADNALVVGATQDDTIATNAGAAYVYVAAGVAGMWSEHLKLLAADGAAGDSFGGYVSASAAGTVIVGAASDDAMGTGSGIARTAPLSVGSPSRH